MKIEESEDYMSKMYLERIIKSLPVAYPSYRNAEEYREIVISHTDTPSNNFKLFVK